MMKLKQLKTQARQANKTQEINIDMDTPARVLAPANQYLVNVPAEMLINV